LRLASPPFAPGLRRDWDDNLARIKTNVEAQLG